MDAKEYKRIKASGDLSFEQEHPIRLVNYADERIERIKKRMIKERPILFSGEMVRAILEGRKTQTRRVISMKYLDASTLKYADCTKGLPNKYGQPGDRLWVRETWDVFALENEVPSIAYRADSTAIPILGKIGYEYQRKDNSHKWRPSIFMPRWASRILLEITNIRVERVRDISIANCLDEGYPVNGNGGKSWDFKPIVWFQVLWDSINGKKYPWESNPWVWVIEFKILEVMNG